MGQNARETLKSSQALRIRLTLDLEDRVNQAWKEGPHRDIDRQQFLLILLRRGVEALDRGDADERLDKLEEMVRWCAAALGFSERETASDSKTVGSPA